MPSPSPDWLRQASDIEREGDGGLGGGGAVMHKFGNGSDCWNTHTNESSSSAAAAVMKRKRKTRARMEEEEEETWRSDRHRRREEREGLCEEDEDDSDDDEEMIVGGTRGVQAGGELRDASRRRDESRARNSTIDAKI